ncbi:conserved hypothetical protein [Anaeromyxobacter dehalogenans 2CP-1]|uniref:Lipoprotein n=1 Tax=Anaeromyxobacter dehalogenans (strain ATCC BAA-258 / DSM 21875 / 2CP-1) TaxID=455488 RepID=B8JDD6_ANAD2|nr:hypothetical protein [Anaeromyxobacter dehalogenans]ACL65985.1 conserved hypothetical protein [Anaeromyxobacter dehalogenans 2CP-1]
MTARNALLLLALAASAGCGSSAAKPDLGLVSPGGVAVFRGLTTKNALDPAHPYVAVANSGRDELIFIDALDDEPVLAPVVIRPLAVPTLPGEPHPTLLASAGLHDGQNADGTGLPDLLVVVSPGSSRLQLVATWDLATHVVQPAGADPLDLGALAPGAQVLDMIAVPVLEPGATAGTWQVARGKARVLASIAGGRLAVVDFARQADGSIAPSGTPALQDLGFEALSLAESPDHDRLFAATVDEVIPGSGVFGVGEIDTTGAVGSWTVRALDARVGTTLVAAAKVTERFVGVQDGDTFCVRQPGDPFCKAPNQDLRVYAFLDPAACGRTARMPCGLAVIDPARGGLMADPTGEMPYLAPMAVPSIPIAIAISGPPALPPTNEPSDVQLSAANGYMLLAPGSGQVKTTGVAVLASGDGRVYMVDLARWHIPLNASILRTSTRTSVTGGTVFSPSLVVPDPENPGKYLVKPSRLRLGLWDLTAWPTVTRPTAALASTSANMPRTVRVTPGYTATDTWTVLYQGPLPGLSARAGQTGATADGRLWLAVQTPLPRSDGSTQLVDVARLFDPSLAVHVGDIAQLAPASTVTACLTTDPDTETPSTTSYETRITAILPPSAAYPGGAVTLDETQLIDLRNPVAAERLPATPECIAALKQVAPAGNMLVTIRAAGLIAGGASMGYVGRPQLESDPTAADPFHLTYSALAPPPLGEDAISCPILPWPAEAYGPNAPAAFTACVDEACRSECERLVLARKARRLYYLSDRCLDIVDGPKASATKGCWVDWAAIADTLPDASGPIVSFHLGCGQAQVDANGDVVIDPRTKTVVEDVCTTELERDMSLTFITQSGIAYAYRGPTTGSNAASSFPVAAVPFDRSPFPGKQADGYRFFVTYSENFLLDMSPATAYSTSKVIR